MNSAHCSHSFVVNTGNSIVASSATHYQHHYPTGSSSVTVATAHRSIWEASMWTTPFPVPLGSLVHQMPAVNNQDRSALAFVRKASFAPLRPAFLMCAALEATVRSEVPHLCSALRAQWGRETTSQVQTIASRVLRGRVVLREAPLLNPVPMACMLRMRAVPHARAVLLERIRTRKGRPSANPVHKVCESRRLLLLSVQNMSATESVSQVTTVRKRRGHPNLVLLVVGVTSLGYPLRSNAKVVRSAPTVQKPPHSLADVPKALQVRSHGSPISASVPIVSHQKAAH
jgi:hypothetical protein